VSGTNATMHTPNFLNKPDMDDQLSAHEKRLSFALDIDQAARMLTHSLTSRRGYPTHLSSAVSWQNGRWLRRTPVKGTRTALHISDY
jgi:hypothetical protein